MTASLASVALRGTVASALLLATALAGFGVAAIYGWQVWQDKRVNALIRGLAAGRDLAVPAEAPPELLHARARFLMTHARLEEGEALLEAARRSGDDALLARLYYDVGNARLRAAFLGVEDRDLDEAVPQVRVAKDAYRRSLALSPDNVDAKVNLDLAMRLVRDFPEGGQDGVEDPKSQPKNLWTELPGTPKGLP